MLTPRPWDEAAYQVLLCLAGEWDEESTDCEPLCGGAVLHDSRPRTAGPEWVGCHGLVTGSATTH